VRDIKADRPQMKTVLLGNYRISECDFHHDLTLC